MINSVQTLAEIFKSDDALEAETLTQLHPNLMPIEREQILVMKVIQNTNTVFEDMDVFENAVHVLNGISPDITKTELVRPEWVWVALEKINKIRPNMEYSHEVQMYIKFVYTDNGYQFFPPLSGLDNPIFDKIKQIAETGPFPLEETPINIQAMRYMKIQEYLKERK